MGCWPVSKKPVLPPRSSNSGQQGIWVFEIGSPATASGVVPSDVNLGLDDGAEYDEEDYDSVTPLSLEDTGTTSFPYEARRRGDTGTYNVPSDLPPRRLATERPPGPPTERTRSFQLPAERFPQQQPQVIDVDEVEETGVGKAIYVAGGTFLDTWVSRQGSIAGRVSAVRIIWWFVRMSAWGRRRGTYSCRTSVDGPEGFRDPKGSGH